MLYYVGKDLARWIEQCLEFAERNQAALPEGICFQSFAGLLIQDAPTGVQAKLRKWGVADYKSIFSRALGLQFCVRRRAAARSALRRIRALLFPLRRSNLPEQAERVRFHAAQLARVPFRALFVGRILADAGTFLGRVILFEFSQRS